MLSSLFLYALMQIIHPKHWCFDKSISWANWKWLRMWFCWTRTKLRLNIWPFPSLSSFLLTSVDQNLKLILVTKYFYNHPQRAQLPYTVHVMLLVYSNLLNLGLSSFVMERICIHSRVVSPSSFFKKNNHHPEWVTEVDTFMWTLPDYAGVSWTCHQSRR